MHFVSDDVQMEGVSHNLYCVSSGTDWLAGYPEIFVSYQSSPHTREIAQGRARRQQVAVSRGFRADVPIAL